VLLGEPPWKLREGEGDGACEGAGPYVRAGGAIIVGPDGAGGAGENRLKLGADRLKLGAAELGAAVGGANVLGVNDLVGGGLGAAWLGAAVGGANVLGVNDLVGAGLGAAELGAAVGGANVLGVNDLVGAALGAAWLGEAVGGANVLGVNDLVGAALGAAWLGEAVGGVKVLGVNDLVGAGLGAASLGAAIGGVKVLGVNDLVGAALGAASLGEAVGGVKVLGVNALGVAVELCGQVERKNLVSGGGAEEVVRGVGVIVTLGVAVGGVTDRGVRLYGVRLLGVRDRGPSGAVLTGGAVGSGATCGWNVLCARVGPAVPWAWPDPADMTLSRLSRSVRIASRCAVTAASVSEADERRETLPWLNPGFVRGLDEVGPAGEVAPNAAPSPPTDGLSAAPPEPESWRLSTSMYASRRCWSRSCPVAPVRVLGEVFNVLPAGATAGARADVPPVVSVRPAGLGKAVARVAPAPVLRPLRLSSAGPR
jgi:hypothetical protein